MNLKVTGGDFYEYYRSRQTDFADTQYSALLRTDRLIPPVARNKGGTREYTSKDLCWIEFIKTMRSAGLSPETLIEYVALSQLGDTTLEARKDILELQREVLQEKLEFIQQTLARIDIKIENYRTDIYQKNHPLQNQKQEEADL